MLRHINLTVALLAAAGVSALAFWLIPSSSFEPPAIGPGFGNYYTSFGREILFGFGLPAATFIFVLILHTVWVRPPETHPSNRPIILAVPIFILSLTVMAVLVIIMGLKAMADYMLGQSSETE